MAIKVIPHTANAITPAFTNKLGQSENLTLTQKKLTELFSGDTKPVLIVEEKLVNQVAELEKKVAELEKKLEGTSSDQIKDPNCEEGEKGDQEPTE